METILVVNAGSSSVKFQIFAVGEAGEPRRLLWGQMDGIGVRPKLRAKGEDGSSLVDKEFATNEVPDVAAAMSAVRDWLRETQKSTLVAVGHRVVHGGPDFDKPVIVDEEVISRLESYVPLAPLHQPNNLAPIRLLLRTRSELPQVACFDTAFHRGHDSLADHFALPQHFYDEGIRRYGFHGLSYEYIAERLREIASAVAAGRVIVAHLGSGASMCAIADGRSVESTMGFTALDGLPMGRGRARSIPASCCISSWSAAWSRRPFATCCIGKAASAECRVSAATCGTSKPVRRPLRRSRSSISSIALDSVPGCWRPRSAGSTHSYSPRVSARTRQPCGHESRRDLVGLAYRSIRPPMRRTRLSSLGPGAG